MILRSLPITDFSPVEGELITLLVPVGVVVRGPSGLGSAGELRVNMKSPNEAYSTAGLPTAIFLAPHLFIAYLAIVVGRAHRVLVDDVVGQWHGPLAGKLASVRLMRLTVATGSVDC
jgi:hypothetical protein